MYTQIAIPISFLNDSESNRHLTHLAVGEDCCVVAIQVRRHQGGDTILVDGRLPVPRREDMVECEAVVQPAHYDLR